MPTEGAPARADAGGGTTIADESAIATRFAEAALAGRRDHEVFGQACEDLLALRVPLLRSVMVTDFLHPTLEARVLSWVRGQGLKTQTVDRAPENAPAAEPWLLSPLYPLVERRERVLRRRIDAASVPNSRSWESSPKWAASTIWPCASRSGPAPSSARSRRSSHPGSPTGPAGSATITSRCSSGSTRTSCWR
jgi:hypothetical protein